MTHDRNDECDCCGAPAEDNFVYSDRFETVVCPECWDEMDGAEQDEYLREDHANERYDFMEDSPVY